MQRLRITVLFIAIFTSSTFAQSGNELPIIFLQGNDTLEVQKPLSNYDTVLMVWSKLAEPTSVEIILGDANVMTSQTVETVRPGRVQYQYT